MPGNIIDNNSHFAFTHIDIFNGEEILIDQYLEIKDNCIVAIKAMQDVQQLTIAHQNAQGLLATAGFIDLQLNGCGGVLLNSDTNQKTLDIMNQTNLKFGTTQYLPTLITSSAEQMVEAIDLIASLTSPLAQGILGLHLEGPFINQQKKGAHQAHFIRQLDKETAYYLAQHNAFIKVITIAPECVTQEVINILAEAGIIVSMGHSNATYQQLEEKQGIQMATHLYNAMSPLTSREPGVVGYVLNHKPHAGIIADGIHVDYAALRLAHDHLGEKLFMVTDAVTPAGTNLTHFDMAGTEAFVTNGKCHFADGTIAGAAITMQQGLKNLIEFVGISREEALRMASLYPAKAINIDHQYGKIALGYKANITLLNEKNDVIAVYQMGVKK
ncbi:N-acetylglucosamine-6-phosphate deacetylase [Psychromonas hadalis]|uniref:N-acetylglucosamine-6-phosphate deacetylase n=1 Tax=Psychromonas hadalis TaxID=211669 RepID=UPI0003B40306|nr:N-acetylglucosamine-6-phosphate deacetylase [Psychromonas hadalis]